MKLSTTIKLEAIGLNDQAELREVCVTSYTAAFASHWKAGGLQWYLQDQFGIERIKRDLLDDDILYYFINVKGLRTGFLKIKVFSGELQAELEKLYLLPEHIGAGIGTKAMSLALQELKYRALRRVFLFVLADNQGAIDFYRRLGFDLVEQTQLELPYFKDDLRSICRMSMLL